MKTPYQISENQFMILLQDMYRGPGSGHILTTTDTPSTFALVGVRRGEVWEKNLSKGLFCL